MSGAKRRRANKMRTWERDHRVFELGCTAERTRWVEQVRRAIAQADRLCSFAASSPPGSFRDEFARYLNQVHTLRQILRDMGVELTDTEVSRNGSPDTTGVIAGARNASAGRLPRDAGCR